LKAALDSEKAQTRSALRYLEQKLALLERDGTRKHASNDNPMTAGSLAASSGGGGGSNSFGLARALPTWSLHALTLALLAAVLFFWRKRTAAQSA